MSETFIYIDRQNRRFTVTRTVVFASGTPTSGGSGFRNLVEVSRREGLRTEVIAVVSQHDNGGVRRHADTLDVPFIHFRKTDDPAEQYMRIMGDWEAQFAALSGWLKFVVGLNPARVFNVHPALLPGVGGEGMHGHHVHQRVMDQFWAGEAHCSGVTMHFIAPVAKPGVIDKGTYDTGPVFFRGIVPILPTDNADTLGMRANKLEHRIQPWLTDLVVTGQIGWDGKDPASLRVPPAYRFHEPLNW